MDSAAPRPWWPGLPPDLIRLISGRFHDAADFARFHAVCKAWRDVLPFSRSWPFLPWLLAPGGYYSPAIAQFRSIFSKTTWGAPGTYCRRNRWLASVDGAGTWLLTVGINDDNPSSSPRLVDPFTGAATKLPPLPVVMEEYIACTDGIVFPDGTISLYAVVRTYKDNFIIVAVLRPGDTAWAHSESYDRKLYFGDCCTATYHGEDIVLVDGLRLNMVKLRVTRSGNDDGAVAAEIPRITSTSLEITRDEQERFKQQRQLCTYIFESRGDLLAVCLREIPRIVNDGVLDAVPGIVSVSIYALDKESNENDGEGGARWVRRDGRSLADRILFLGNPTSFAVDAALFGGAVSGGCAYFVLPGWTRMHPQACRVYSHSFEDGSTTVVEELPAGRGWDDGSCMTWFIPQPSGIAPAHEIRERLLQAPVRKQDARCPESIIRFPRTGPGPYFKVYVGNLPAWVDSFQLRLFFMRYGEIADARVICDARTGRSWGFGFVTMATVYESDDAIAVLDGEIFYGHALRVKFGEERPEGPFVMPLLAKNKKAAPEAIPSRNTKHQTV